MKYDVIAWGDSWGTPGWYPQLSNNLQEHYTKQYHTNNILREEYKFLLLDMAKSLNSNTGSQEHMIQMYHNTKELPPHITDREIETDYVLWYFTELGRNFDRDQPWNYEESIGSATRDIINVTKECLSLLSNPKIIIIECLGSPTPEIIDELPVLEVIPWRQKLLNFDDEMCALRLFSETQTRMDPQNTDSFFKRNQIVKMSERDRQMYDKARDWFPDGSHPGDRAHFSLARRVSFILANDMGGGELDWHSWEGPKEPVSDRWNDAIEW